MLLCRPTGPLPNGERARGFQATTALAAYEPQAPGGVYLAACSGAAAAESERNQLGKSGEPLAGYAFGALAGGHGIAKAGRLRGLLQAP